MISPPAQGAAPGLSGTNRDPITIRALHDGQVLIDGQFQRPTLYLSRNSWFTIEGINVRNSSGTNIHIRETTGVILRRIVAWDARFTGKSEGLLLNQTVNTLVEDVALFGTGMNNTSSYHGSGNVYRRVWARWEGSSAGDSKRAIAVSYGNGNNPAKCENCLATWTAESMPQQYHISSDGKGKFVGDVMTNWAVNSPQPLISYGTTDFTVNLNEAYIVGSLAYMMPASSGQPSARGQDHPPGGYRAHNQTNWTLRHVMAFISPSHFRFNSFRGFEFFNIPAQQGTLDHATSVRGSLGDNLGPNNTITNLSAAGVGSTTLNVDPWTNAGGGVNLCKRWVNGQLTAQPLWPWPMEARIRAATAIAGSAFGSGNPCLNCVGLPGPRRETSVTGQMETLFGPIPSACRS